MNQAAWPEFDNSYARLPERFFSYQSPRPVSTPGLIRVNRALACQLGFNPDWLASTQGLDFLAGNFVPDNAEPIAMAYAGHQFGGWNPQLGDGRAILLGEVLDQHGQRFDIQLKGSGRTPYSRGGDGRAPLGPVLREYVVSEAMAVLGVPTTRALGAVTTGETVLREKPLPGAVLTRVAQSHIRIGSFQFFSSRQDTEAIRLLAGHVIQRHFPQLADSDKPILGLLNEVIKRQANLVAQWQCLGFIHGVMNTDNMLLSGETIDYGPCAFMDGFNQNTVYSSIDHGGRYAYSNQPRIAHWNLTALAQSLLPVLDDNTDKALAMAQASVDVFPSIYQAAFRQQMLIKLGLPADTSAGIEKDDELILDLFDLMQTEHTDFTLTFRHLADRVHSAAESTAVGQIFDLPDSFSPWLKRWQQRLEAHPLPALKRQTQMYLANPAFIPRNHLLEEAIQAAEKHGDFSLFEDLVEVLSRPFEYRASDQRFALPPEPDQVVAQTFCGT